MFDLRRIRLDCEGVITQDEAGVLRRKMLPTSEAHRLISRPLEEFPRIAELDRVVSRLFASGVPIEVVPEHSYCLSRPLRIYYGLEPACNLHCTYCGPRDLHNLGRRVTPQWELFLLEQIAAAGAFQVQLTGGEIGMRGMNLVPILEKAAELNLAVLLATNGVWNCIPDREQFLRELARFRGLIIQAKISLDGDKAFHDSVRGNGSYAETVKTLAQLSELGLNPRISATIFAESCTSEQLRHLVELAKRYRAGFQPIPLRPIGRARGMKQRAPSREQLAAYTAELSQLRRDTGVAISCNFDIIDPQRPIPMLATQQPASCGAPMWGIHLTHLGEVFPCGFAQEVEGGTRFLAGRVSETTSLLDIWLRSDVLREVRTAGKSQECHGCEHYGTHCWGGCWVKAFLETGAVNGMDSCCFRDSDFVY